MKPEVIWQFDINRRVYEKPEAGRLYATGGPIWREHWRALKVTGETRVSWLLENGDKCPKKDPNPSAWAFSQEDIDQLAWVHDHRYKIERLVSAVTNYNTLKRIAALVNYDESAGRRK